MKIILRVVLLTIVITAGVWLWTVFFPSAQKLIRQQLAAVADLTLKAQAAGDKDFTVQEMKVTLQKTDGKWLITRVETVRTLS